VQRGPVPAFQPAAEQLPLAVLQLLVEQPRAPRQTGLLDLQFPLLVVWLLQRRLSVSRLSAQTFRRELDQCPVPRHMWIVEIDFGLARHPVYAPPQQVGLAQQAAALLRLE